MKRTMPWSEHIDVISSDDDESSSGLADMSGIDELNFSPKITIDQPAKDLTPEDFLMKRAEIYQHYMSKIPIPSHHGSVVPFSSWVGLGDSLKKLYGQPLHYLTNVLLYRWDHQRTGSENEQKPLDFTIHPSKAEATVWLVEEIHRFTSSHQHLAKLWMKDPMFHTNIDAIFPQL